VQRTFCAGKNEKIPFKRNVLPPHIKSGGQSFFFFEIWEQFFFSFLSSENRETGAHLRRLLGKKTAKNELAIMASKNRDII
jgi:hypothetical protein